MPTASDIRDLQAQVKAESGLLDQLVEEVSRTIVGQKSMVERLILGLLCHGHVLLEGVPGLAKTLAVKTLASCMRAKFQRLQFTPDLLPADLIGTMIYNQKTGGFEAKKGPIFANFVLADEINRAPAKVQSALLEAMQERQVTIGDTTYPLPEPFLVLATQNPIEQEGTYPLPEAQVDRFMMKLKIDYPSRAEERLILDRMTDPWMADGNGSKHGNDGPPAKSHKTQAIIDPADLLRMSRLAERLYVAPEVKDYIVDLVFATRKPEIVRADLKGLLEFGASPRATISLAQAAKAHAFLRHRGHVTPDDVKSVALDVLRHRISPTYEAEAENMTPDDLVLRLLEAVKVP